MTFVHNDEHGQPCALHPAPALSRWMSLALVGAGASRFHHDIASTLQRLMMAIDELGEAVEGAGPGPRLAVETASIALKDLNGLLNRNRVLIKAPVQKRTSFRELVTLASAQVYMTIVGELPEAVVDVCAPMIVHGLSIALDVAAGPGSRRTLSPVTSISGGKVVMALPATPDRSSTAAESLAIATFLLQQDGGDLRCSTAGDRLIIEVPVATEPT